MLYTGGRGGSAPEAGRGEEAERVLSRLADWLQGPAITERELYRQLVISCGAETQLFRSLEALAELQDAICKCVQGRADAEAVAEEIADVLVMLGQVMLILDISEESVRDSVVAESARLFCRLCSGSL